MLFSSDENDPALEKLWSKTNGAEQDEANERTHADTVTYQPRTRACTPILKTAGNPRHARDRKG